MNNTRRSFFAVVPAVARCAAAGAACETVVLSAFALVLAVALAVTPRTAFAQTTTATPTSHTKSVGAAAPHVVHADLQYRAPRVGVTRPNFSPKGDPVVLTDVPASFVLPAGAVRPAKTGVMKIGPDRFSWIPILATASSEYPKDLVNIYVDFNRNGSFSDEGPPLSAVPSLNAKTKAWWTTVNSVEVMLPYSSLHSTQPYMVNFWSVRDDSLPAPSVLRYSTASWRVGSVSVDGVDALVAAWGDNDGVFDKTDMWSVIGASEPKATSAVLSINEARNASRLMFVPTASGAEKVLQFKRFSPDGSGVDFVVLDAPVTKAQDRAPDDLVRDERARPRAGVPVSWSHGSSGLESALAAARASGKHVLIDFEATWCGPCHTMDEWVWSDAEVASAIATDYIGVKIDVDLEKGLVSRFKTVGYPTMLILDGSGTEVKRHMDYMGSKEILGFLKK